MIKENSYQWDAVDLDSYSEVQHLPHNFVVIVDKYSRQILDLKIVLGEEIHKSSPLCMAPLARNRKFGCAEK